MTKQEIFKAAHELTRSTIKAGDNYRVTFGAALRIIMAKPAAPARVIVENGNKTVEIEIVGFNAWEKEGLKRTYIKLSHTNKRTVFSSLYIVESGATRDDTVSVGGKTYGYKFGFDVNSKSKRAAALEALTALIKQI